MPFEVAAHLLVLALLKRAATRGRHSKHPAQGFGACNGQALTSPYCSMGWMDISNGRPHLCHMTLNRLALPPFFLDTGHPLHYALGEQGINLEVNPR